MAKGLQPSETAQHEAGRAARRQAYYDVLQRDPDFRRDLAALFARVFPEFCTPLTPQQWEKTLRRTDARGPTREHERALAAFVGLWHLPRPWAAELSYCLDRARYEYGRPRLSVIPGVTPQRRGSPKRFLYDPTEPESSAVRRLVVQMRKDRRPRLAPRLIDPEARRRVARRLYRRALLAWPWGRIAETERRETGRRRHVTWQDVRSTVHDWARLLGVDLPKGRPGHPSRSAKPRNW